MRRIFKGYVWPSILLFFVMLLDGQISTLFLIFLGEEWHVASHLFFIFILFLSVNLSENTIFWVSVALGILYDSYYFDVIGVAALLFPILNLLVVNFNFTFMFHRITRILTIFMLSFFFEFGSFLLSQIVGLTSVEMGHFIVYSVTPSLVFNVFLILIFQPIFEKFYL